MLYINNDIFIAAFAAFFVDLIPQLGCLFAAIILHRKMLYGVIRAPLSFFDTTPMGRILARFSSDVDELDNYFPDDIIGIINYSFEVILLSLIIVLPRGVEIGCERCGEQSCVCVCVSLILSLPIVFHPTYTIRLILILMLKRILTFYPRRNKRELWLA